MNSKVFFSLCFTTATTISFSDLLNSNVSGIMDPGSLDHQSSLSRNTTSSPTTFFEGSLLSPANILPGGMMTPCTSSGSEGRESSAYIQPHHQHRRRELELLKTKQELESLKYGLCYLLFSSTPHVVRRRTHEKLVESHSLLMATYVESTKRQRMEDRAPLPSPGSALALHAPNAAPFPPPITQTQGPSRPHRGWKELIERKYSYTMPMKPGVGISAR